MSALEIQIAAIAIAFVAGVSGRLGVFASAIFLAVFAPAIMGVNA